MFTIDKSTRDEIVRVLQVQIVPASAGSTLMQIAQILANLKEVEEPKKEDKKDA